MLKSVALFELFGLNDCGVELLEAFGDALAPYDVGTLRATLLEEATGFADYDAYLGRFKEYANARRYRSFPDDYTILAEGFAIMRDGDPQTATFRQP
ncbi:MAG: hypothetical protein JO359_05025 [Candidatus Eremiobacteraeota bacterium]|nr:hypothetical protein [Candidatus Eremiobacteraeota bacterium]